MRWHTRIPLAAALVAGLLSCTSVFDLTPQGSNVLLVYEKDVTRECRVMAQVTTGVYSPREFQDAQALLRNQTADMGGNAMMFQVFVPGKEATGKALQCTSEFLYAFRQRSVDNRVNNETNSTPVLVPREDEVSDPLRRLVWQRCTYGQYREAADCKGAAVAVGWDKAIDYCQSLDTDERSWRVPSIEELRGIVKRGETTGPKIDQRVFPRTRQGVYWSTTFYQNNGNTNWVVDFSSGESFGYGNANQGFVRCVTDRPE